MTSISRRAFLKRSGAGVAAAGLAGAVPTIPGRVRVSRKAATVHANGVATPTGRAASGPLVVHIPDAATGEVHLMVGTREVIRSDRALVARLVREAG